MSEQTATHEQPNYKAVFWSLFFLTLLELITANLPIAKVLIVVVLIALALIKAGLVALFYMHLKFEKFLIYLIVIFPICLAIGLVTILLLDKGTIYLHPLK